MTETEKYVFGANIIENLTTGMYQDSRVIFREYIQNGTDSIDQAVADGILQQNEGKIEIWLKPQSNRTVVVRDNGTGISSVNFRKILCGIGNSEKQIGKNRGFRGIGRLCGLAYCKELIFQTKAKGEKTVSVMRFNAEEMRALITDHNKGNKKEAEAVLKQVGKFEKSESEDEVDEHYFQVTLKNVNDENTDLLDDRAIKEYLSFVAPIPYLATFPLRKKIKDYARRKGQKIEEYKIKLDGEELFKGYTEKIKGKNDTITGEVFDIAFKDFVDESGNLLAWLWVGISKFEGALPKINSMRSIRLRKHNIQIGNADTLQKFFIEDRGHSYFVGEIFAVTDNLIPNSQRDYFNENQTRQEFQRLLEEYFQNELQKVYKSASRVNSGIKKINAYEDKKAIFTAKEKNGKFINEKQKNEERAELEELREKAEEANKDIAKIEGKAKEDGGFVAHVIEKIKEDSKVKPTPLPPMKPIQKKRTDILGNLTSREKKIVERVYETIISHFDGCETADNLIDEIAKALKKGFRK